MNKNINTKVKKFHQFIVVEKGPVNTAIIDLLKGNVYQVENNVIDTLEKGAYREIPGFIASAAAEGLLIEVNEKNWIPADENAEVETEDNEIGIELHVEGGIDLEAVLETFKDYTIYNVVFYGRELPEIPAYPVEIIKKEKNFQQCTANAKVDANFDRVTESFYLFNKKYNCCWGGKVAITREGKIRPCIYSSIVAGDIDKDAPGEILEKLKKYWTITKDKVEKCKECELRYVCFDCREIACRKGDNLFSAHPLCSYDPCKGKWQGE